MIEVIGKHNAAKCFTDILEPDAEAQIRSVCDEFAFSDSKIRIMPDVHAGIGCTIGTAMTVTDKVVPSMVGVDIGCGMETVCIANSDINMEKLDKLIRAEIPSGREVRNTVHRYASDSDLSSLRCASHIDIERALHSIGTLGGGNHFIEIDRGEDGTFYLVIHSGSRHVGKEVAMYYQKKGALTVKSDYKAAVGELIEKLKSEGRYTEIPQAVRKFKAGYVQNARDLAYITGQVFEDYIHDMRIIQHFASLNRKAMTDIIINGMSFTEKERFTTIHNYIDTEEMMLRKGAVSAKKGEKLLIPINMRDGSLICMGKGNEDWNFSAPHGAGRIMSRSAAFRTLSLDNYKEQMTGIYSTCVNERTLDESPMAYKSMEHIVSQIQPTADIISIIKPVYNFKAED